MASVELYRLLAHAYRLSIVSQPQEGGLPDCTASAQDWKNTLEETSEVYTFRVGASNTREYKIVFNGASEHLMDRGVELFGRGATFVREILNEVFGKYTLLRVKEVVYKGELPDDVKKSLMALAAAGENVAIVEVRENEKKVEESYRYRVKLCVVIKDQLGSGETAWDKDGSGGLRGVNTKRINVELSVRFINGSLIYSPVEAQPVETQTAVDMDEENDMIAFSELPKKDQTALKSLAEKLSENEEKERIFNYLSSELTTSPVARYIKERLSSSKYETFRYNIEAQAVYLDRVRRKNVKLRFKSGDYKGDFEIDVDTDKPVEKSVCPKCKAEINGTNKLKLARRGNKAFVGCEKCVINLSRNGVYSTSEFPVFAREDVLDAIIDSSGRTEQMFVGDVFTSTRDGKKYKKKEVEHHANEYYDGNNLVRAATSDLFPQWDIYFCPNCKSTYATSIAQRAQLKEDGVLEIEVQDNKQVLGCKNCIGIKQRNGIPLHEIYVSDISGACFVNPKHAVRCRRCGRIAYTGCGTSSGEIRVCEICGEEVCTLCGTVELGQNGNTFFVCNECMGILHKDHQTHRDEHYYNIVEPNIDLKDRKRRHVSQIIEKDGRNYRLVVAVDAGGSRRTVYVFGIYGCRYYPIVHMVI